MAPRNRILRPIAVVGLLLALLCAPPVAGSLIALEPLHADDLLPLWLLSATMAALSAWIGWGRSPRRAPVGAMLLPLLMLGGVEVLARAWILLGPLEQREELALLARRTYRDTMAYQPHPFLQFTGRPKVALVGNEALGNLLPFNALGFEGPLPALKKGPDTLRIACLGGSTTVRGYPGVMQEQLKSRVPEPWRVEVLNLGMGWYSSTHSVVNLALNAVDFDPDYVVFHNAWNDSEARDRGVVRGDYSHAYQPFQYPRIRDAWLIRGSVLYRWLKGMRGKPDFAFLDKAVVRPRAGAPAEPFSDLTELAPYRRNVATFVDLALARNMVAVLTTQPHSVDPEIPGAAHARHIDQCNAIVREEAARYGDRVLHVDLDLEVTGVHDELFVDLGHMNGPGISFKARAIGDAILDHWTRRRQPR